MNEMTERDCFEALGLTPPEEDGGETRDADGQEPTADAESQELAAQEEPAEVDTPAEEPAQEADGLGASEDSDEGENEREPAEPADEIEPAQSKAERARQAAARRKREQEEAVRQARQEEQQALDAELKELFGWAGFKNGAAPIESLEDFRAYRQQAENAQLEKDLKDGRLTPDMLRQLVKNELLAQQPAPAQEEPGMDPAFQAQVEAELAEIRKYDPRIQTVQDFGSLDRADAFFREIRDHNHSFLEAYRIAYADKIAAASAKRAAAASAQRALNNARSKDHMRPAGARGSEEAAVPADIMNSFKALNPKASNEDIRKYYQKFVKRTAK